MDVKTFRSKACEDTTGRSHLPDHDGLSSARRGGGGAGESAGRRELAEITPFWRVLDEAAPTTARLSCGVAFVRKQRKAEGI